MKKLGISKAIKKNLALYLIIGGAVLLVAILGIVSMLKKDEKLPIVNVAAVTTGDVKENIDTSGTVESQNKKVFFSPVNAIVQKQNFKMGDSVTAGTQLIDFNLETLEKDNQKAEMTALAGQYGYQDTLNKSNKTASEKADAAGQVDSLEAQVEAQQQYVADLNSAIKGAAVDAANQAQADAANQAADAANQAKEVMEAAQEAKKQAIEAAQAQVSARESEVRAAQQMVTNEENQVVSLQTQYNSADIAYKAAEIKYNSATTTPNKDVLLQAGEERSQKEASLNAAKYDLENARTVLGDSKSNLSAAQQELNNARNMSLNYTGGSSAGMGSGTGAPAVDTSDLENQLQQASTDLAELQSTLASKKALAEGSDAGILSSDGKAQLEVNTNLAELESKTVAELIEDGKKGIQAEFNGVISDVKSVEGATTAQGMELFTLASTDDVNVAITISKYDFEKVKEGQKAIIKMADKQYNGTVSKINKIAVKNEKGTPVIGAQVHIDNPDANIFLGVEAKVSIAAAEAKNALLISSELVNTGNEGDFCYIVEDGKVTKKIIETGVASNNQIQVTKGLKKGDLVITDLGNEIKEGTKVESNETDMNQTADAAKAGEKTAK